MAMVGFGSLFLLVVALKPIAQEFGWPRSVPSLAFSLFYVGEGLGGVAIGYWLDRAGMGKPALLGALMIGSGAIVASYATNQWHLYVAFGLMMGLLGQSNLFSPMVANISHWFSRNRGMAIGIVLSGQTLAGAIWPPIFRYFNDSIGWRGTFFWYGVFALTVMVPVSLVLRRRPPAQPAALHRANQLRGGEERHAPGRSEPSVPSRHSGAPTISTLSIQVALSAAVLACCIAMGMPFTHLLARASDLGHAPARAAEMVAVMLLAGFATRVFGVGFLSARLGGLGALLVFSCMQGTMLTVLIFTQDLVWLYVVAALFGLGYAGIVPCYPIIIREYLPARQAGRRMGAVAVFASTGMAIGGWLGGYMYDLNGSYDAVFALGVASNVVNLVIVGTLIRWRRHGRLIPIET